MEWVDEVDATDRVVARRTRAEIRRLRLWHRCVWIVVLDDAHRIFIHQRTSIKDVYPSFWDVACGGVVAAGESYDEAARRELAEELGIRGGAGAARASIVYQDASNRTLGRVYVRGFTGEPVLQESEIVRGEWVSGDELAQLLAARRFCPDGLMALSGLLEADVTLLAGAGRSALREALARVLG